MTRAVAEPRARTATSSQADGGSIDARCAAAIAALRARATRATLDGMARFGLPSRNAFGVAMGDIQKLAKTLPRDHALADALWRSGWYEARMLACYLDDPAQVTPAQMDRWCRDFDNWGTCDTVCFALFDRTPHAWAKVASWAKRRDEFQKRAAFALLASLALHRNDADDDAFLAMLPLIEQASDDERNFVRKAVNWALRSIGNRNPVLLAASLDLATRLSASNDATPRWIGKDALRQLAKRSAARAAKASRGEHPAKKASASGASTAPRSGRKTSAA